MTRNSWRVRLHKGAVIPSCKYDHRTAKKPDNLHHSDTRKSGTNSGAHEFCVEVYQSMRLKVFNIKLIAHFADEVMYVKSGVVAGLHQ